MRSIVTFIKENQSVVSIASLAVMVPLTAFLVTAINQQNLEDEVSQAVNDLDGVLPSAVESSPQTLTDGTSTIAITTFDNLDDTPDTYVGNENALVVVDESNNGLSFLQPQEITVGNASRLGNFDPEYYLAAENISGELNTDNFNAYADLTASGRLDNNSSSDLLVRQQLDDRYLSLNGGSLSGQLLLSGNPASALAAVTRQYVDSLSFDFLDLGDTPDSFENDGYLLAADAATGELEFINPSSVGGSGGGGTGVFSTISGESGDFVYLNTASGDYNDYLIGLGTVSPNEDYQVTVGNGAAANDGSLLVSGRTFIEDGLAVGANSLSSDAQSVVRIENYSGEGISSRDYALYVVDGESRFDDRVTFNDVATFEQGLVLGEAIPSFEGSTPVGTMYYNTDNNSIMVYDPLGGESPSAYREYTRHGAFEFENGGSAHELYIDVDSSNSDYADNTIVFAQANYDTFATNTCTSSTDCAQVAIGNDKDAEYALTVTDGIARFDNGIQLGTSRIAANDGELVYSGGPYIELYASGQWYQIGESAFSYDPLEDDGQVYTELDYVGLGVPNPEDFDARLVVDGNGEAPYALASEGLTRINGNLYMNGDVLPGAGSDNFGVAETSEGEYDLGSSDNYWGSVHAVNFVTEGGVDLAENFYVTDPSIEAGEVVRIKETIASGEDVATVERAGGNERAYDRDILGVVSTAPGVTLSEGSSLANARPVALAGRVPVKVTNENGSIKRGDFLTAASKEGYAMKASEGGMMLGRALEDFDAADGTIVIFVDLGYVGSEMFEDTR